MLYLIGLGLNDENDLTLKAVNTMKKCDSVFIELYTNKWLGDIKKLEEIAGKEIKAMERIGVESSFLVNEAKKKDVALLIPGDPLTATTHMELVIEAKKKNISVEIVHSSSIYTAIAESGLQLYKFGRSTTLVYPEERFKPESPFNIIKENMKAGLHTLVLLDIKQDEEKYMTANEGIDILIENNVVSEDTIAIACCQLGSASHKIKCGKIKNLVEDKSISGVPASIIIPGKLHFKEEEALDLL